MNDVSMFLFVRACVEDSRSDLVGYYESHRSVPADTTEHDDALRWLDHVVAKALGRGPDGQMDAERSL